MSDWLRSYWGFVLLTILGVVICDILTFPLIRLIRRRWGLKGVIEGTTLQNVGTVLAISLGLVTASIWSGYSNCGTAQTTFAESLLASYRQCRFLPKEQQAEIGGLFHTFIHSLEHLTPSMLSAGPSSPLWEPLEKARVLAHQGAAALSNDAEMVAIDNSFLNMLRDRHLWAASFFYDLPSVLWVGMLIASFLTILGSASYEGMEGIHARASVAIFSLPVVLLLVTCWVLSYPFGGMAAVDLSPITSLGPLFQAH